MKKKFYLFFLVLFSVLVSFSITAQTTETLKANNTNVTEETAVGTNTNVDATDETSFLISSGSEASSNETTQSGPSTFWVFARMILVLALIVACIYFVMRFMKRKMNPSSSEDPYLKKVASLSIDVGKSVHVITLNNHAYLIGTAENSVALLGEIDDKELIDSMNLNADKTKPTAQADFSSLISNWIPGIKPKKKSSEPESTKTLTNQQSSSVESRMRKYHERLSEIDSEEV